MAAKPDRMHIAFLISSLRCGGAERVVATLANHWAEKGWKVDLITLSGGEAPPFYPLGTGVTHHALGVQGSSGNKLSAVLNNLKRYSAIRKTLKKIRPQILISFMAGTNVFAVLATRGLGIRVVISERGVPGLQAMGRFWGPLHTLLYPYADKLVVPSFGMCAHFETKMKISPVVIPNPVMIDAKEATRSAGAGKKRILAVGRLSPEKGFPLLLQVFKKILHNHPESRLRIVGEGPEREKLLSLTHELKIEDKVSFPGLTKNVLEEMRNADVLAVSSLHESFGNVICEAMAVGLPPISFNCPTGPADIIKDGVDGILITPEDVEEMAKTISTLFFDPVRLSGLGTNALLIRERLKLENIALEWEKLFSELLR